jgi:hypothetical protein
MRKTYNSLFLLLTIISLLILMIMTSGAHANKYFNRSHILFKIFDSENLIFNIVILTKTHIKLVKLLIKTSFVQLKNVKDKM